MTDAHVDNIEINIFCFLVNLKKIIHVKLNK